MFAKPERQVYNRGISSYREYYGRQKDKMEQGDLTLEQSLEAFSNGIQLTRECQTRLAEAEQQVNLLLEQQGEITLVEFDTSDDE